MSAVAMVPGSPGWVISIFRPKLELKVRRELAKLEHAVEASAVVLWLPGGTRPDEVITFVGDRDVLPRRFEHLQSAVASYIDVVIDGVQEEAVVCGVRLGRGLPTLGLAAICPGRYASAELLHAVRGTGEMVEEIVVEALS
jgi:hypothetical protein